MPEYEPGRSITQLFFFKTRQETQNINFDNCNKIGNRFSYTFEIIKKVKTLSYKPKKLMYNGLSFKF